MVCLLLLVDRLLGLLCMEGGCLEVVVVGFGGVMGVFVVGVVGRVGGVLFFSWFSCLFRFRYWFWLVCLSWVFLCCNCFICDCSVCICVWS